uniref:GB1/RHD3-type G domain-containing protein n=1 Tax=Panagrolaimus superbus TaxID=310955 RepID=A0A914YEX4_9BILA
MTYNDIQLDWLGDDAQVQGFHWRSGAKRDTVGIWLWGEPIMIEAGNGEKYAVVLMDTQGTFDNNSTLKQCTTIFGLSTLLSSHQCYNVVDNIPEDALQHLSLFVEYGRLALKEAQDFGKPFQALSFIVRDFKSPEEYSYGYNGGKKFLEQVLQVTPKQPEELRDVRLQLAECFNEISCYLLPHPGYKVAERTSFKGYVKDLRPVFREEIKRMTQSLLDPHVLKPKIVNGKEEFARVFDSNELPEPRSILNANAQLLCVESASEAKTSYCRGMDRYPKV